jgi:hypothetical protein
MASIVVGSILTIDLGAVQEQVAVTAVTGTTFTATFQNAHNASAKVCGVPDDILTGMQLLVAHWYQNREDGGVPARAWNLLQGNDYGAYP